MRFLLLLFVAAACHAQTGVAVQGFGTFPAGTLLLNPTSRVTVYPSSVQNGVICDLVAPLSQMYVIVGLSQTAGPDLITATDWVLDRGVAGTQTEVLAIWNPPFASGMSVFVQYASVVGGVVQFTNQVAIVL